MASPNWVELMVLSDCVDELTRSSWTEWIHCIRPNQGKYCTYFMGCPATSTETAYWYHHFPLHHKIHVAIVHISSDDLSPKLRYRRGSGSLQPCHWRRFSCETDNLFYDIYHKNQQRERVVSRSSGGVVTSWINISTPTVSRGWWSGP